MLLFLALMPQFLRGNWPVAAQIAALGLIHTTICAIVYSGVATTARAVLRTRPAAATWVTRSSGIAMILIATALLLERLH